MDCVASHEGAIELSIVMPCLNEAETVSICTEKAIAFLKRHEIAGEVIVADNGSTDGSQGLAARSGARVVVVPVRGYGAALIAGIQAAKGRLIIMGDADDSYDFSALMPFVEQLRCGADLVMGNRFRGGIARGAMPFLHRYLGNPVLSFIGRLFFPVDIGDFHCGLRGFNKDRIVSLDLRTLGMEFASEMVVRSALAGYRIAEVPTTLRIDGRSRPPHLRTWRDGWRHLRFLLIFSPRWLFLYPGLFILTLGIVGSIALLPGPLFVGGVGFDIHTFMVMCVAIVVGLQAITFGMIARRFGTSRGLIPRSPRFGTFLDLLTVERMLIGALCIGLGGAGGVLWCIVKWVGTSFGPLEYGSLIRVLMLSLTAIAAALQLGFSAFLSGVIDLGTKSETPS